jgi:hypothetical protein
MKVLRILVCFAWQWLLGTTAALLLIFACIGMGADDQAVPDSVILSTFLWGGGVAAISGWPLFKILLEPLWELL